MPANLQHTLDFLQDLRANNDREWFNAHRDSYEVARAAFKDLITEVIAKFGGVDDLGDLTADETLYRINRDVRFSPDKSPYKLNMGALIGKEGRKSATRSYYVQIEPGDSFVAGGLYMVAPNDLERIRRAIADDDRPLRSLVTSPSFKKFFGEMQGERVKTAPKNYSKNHPAIDLLRYKQFIAIHPLSEAQVVADDLPDRIVKVCAALKPFVEYLDEVLTPA